MQRSQHWPLYRAFLNPGRSGVRARRREKFIFPLEKPETARTGKNQKKRAKLEIGLRLY